MTPVRAARAVEGKMKWDQRCRWDAQRSRTVGTALCGAWL